MSQEIGVVVNEFFDSCPFQNESYRKVVQRIPWVKTVLSRWNDETREIMRERKYCALIEELGLYFIEVRQVIFIDDLESDLITDPNEIRDLKQQLGFIGNVVVSGQQVNLHDHLVEELGLPKMVWYPTISANPPLMGFCRAYFSIFKHLNSFEQVLADEVPNITDEPQEPKVSES